MKPTKLQANTPTEQELLGLVDKKLNENPKLQYHEALKLVASERRDLDRRYTALGRGILTGRD
ncbi:MAG TPA: hypothetical protein VKV17_17870 [Bryobacteraceae bacterium]|nr:hypothetical protein [Bryobacteraceae bacterium]